MNADASTSTSKYVQSLQRTRGRQPAEVVIRPARRGDRAVGVLALSVGYWFLPGEGCRGRRKEATTWTPPSQPTSRTHTGPQGVSPPTRPGSQPYMPAVQGGAANRRTLAVAVSKPCSPEAKTIRRTIPTALGSYHQPGQRASA